MAKPIIFENVSVVFAALNPRYARWPKST